MYYVFLGDRIYNMSPQQTAANEAAKFVAKFNAIILFPTIALLTGIAFLVFLWGVAQYFMNANNDQARQQGVQHMTWGIIGLVVMVSAFAIISLAVNTFGLGQQLSCADNPSASGCDSVFTIPNPGGQPPSPGPNPGGQPPSPGPNPGGQPPSPGPNPGGG